MSLGQKQLMILHQQTVLGKLGQLTQAETLQSCLCMVEVVAKNQPLQYIPTQNKWPQLVVFLQVLLLQ